MFSGAGSPATLTCANVAEGFPKCSSTTWLYNRNRESTVEEAILGKFIAENTLRAKRWSLLPNCSLRITHVSTEDAGIFTCRQYEGKGGRQIREDAMVELAVLTSKSDKSDIPMTLKCFTIM